MCARVRVNPDVCSKCLLSICYVSKIFLTESISLVVVDTRCLKPYIRCMSVNQSIFDRLLGMGLISSIELE